jgi:hypothetical protein
LDASYEAIVDCFGGEQELFLHLAIEAKNGSFKHLKLLMEYAYGKPSEQKEDEQSFQAPILENGKTLPADE